MILHAGRPATVEHGGDRRVGQDGLRGTASPPSGRRVRVDTRGYEADLHVADVDESSALAVPVTFTDDTGHEATLVSAATDGRPSR